MGLFNSNRGEGKTGGVGLVLIILAGYLLYTNGFINIGGNAQSGVPAGSGSTGSTGSSTSGTLNVVSDCTQSTTLSGSVLRLYTDATLSSENITVYQNGIERATISNGGTTTVQSGAKNADLLDIYPALQSTTYYANHFQGKLGTCTGAATTGDSQFKVVVDPSPGGARVTSADSVPNKVLAMGTTSTSITITNDGQSNAQDGSGNQAGNFENLSIGAGATGSVAIQFKVPTNEAWGPIGGNIMACQYPSAIYDATNPIAVTVNGQALTAAEKNPSSQQFILSQSNNTVKSFKFPGIDGRLTPVVSGNIVVKADTNHDPASLIDRINCTVFDTNYYKRQVDGKWVLDTENRDTNADLGAANSIMDFVIGVE